MNLDFGALSEPLADQLRAHHVTLRAEAISHFQQDADAITRLAIRQLLPDATVRAARKKLMKRLVKGLESEAAASLKRELL